VEADPRVLEGVISVWSLSVAIAPQIEWRGSQVRARKDQTKKGAHRSERPSDALVVKEAGLHLLLGARFGRSIPCAASLLAISFCLGGGHVSREGRASEGECQSQRER
jgi:hypothetical protein